MRKVVFKLFLILTSHLFLALSTTAQSADNNQRLNSDAWQALRSGDAIILMRHALAPGTGDPVEFVLDKCTTQRNLSDAGRDQAVAIGNVIRAHGISKATIMSSQWCRCLETAELLNLGEVEPTPMLNSFFQDWSTEQEQTHTLRNSLRVWLTKDSDVKVLVTHQVNISSLTDQFASSGDMLIVALENNEPVVLAKISTN